MNFLSQKLLDALSKNIDDADYLADKKAEFSRLDTLGAAREIANFDAQNQATLAEMLGVAPIELAAFSKVLGRL